MNDRLRSLAFYLPQFHPIPENDEWWGTGFTEWRNVVTSKPVVPGHYQPHLPADLGFYDLRLPEVRQAQAELATKYSIDGFCYYHYWFNGKRVLERPVQEIVESGEPDFPFCLCWANEDWTRAWDGRSGHTLLKQNYSSEDDQEHIETLLPILGDSRYIKVNGKPLFLVYRTELLPNPKSTADIWREAAIKSGLGEIYLARVESFTSDIDPASIGFDAAVEFAPDWRKVKAQRFSMYQKVKSLVGLFPKGYFQHRFAHYENLVSDMRAKPTPPFRRFRCVTPGFDNSARRQQDATIFLNNTPSVYGDWLRETVLEERSAPYPESEKLVFINAWNEWAEGNHLEPDQRYGHAFLEATRNALK